jgi:urocanate hydratase
MAENGAVFSNWAQYLLTMKYLSEMTDEQPLMYSGHPMGLKRQGSCY